MVGEGCVWHSLCKRCNLPGSLLTAPIGLETSYLTWTVLTVFAVPLSRRVPCASQSAQPGGGDTGGDALTEGNHRERQLPEGSSGAIRHTYTQLLHVEKGPHMSQQVSHASCIPGPHPPTM